MSPELEALGRTLKQQFVMHMHTTPAHLYSHNILDANGKVIARKSTYSPKKSEKKTIVYTMDDKDYETVEAFLSAYRDKLRDQEWEAADPKKETAS